MSDEIRAAKGLLTVSTVDHLVAECLGSVQALVIVGVCRSGKTWATMDWVASRSNQLEHVAYVDCRGIVFRGAGVVSFNGTERDLRENHYPRFALDGIDVVIVDEPQVNRGFVRSLLSHTSPVAGTAAHRLVVLLAQHMSWLEELGVDAKHVRCYSTAGLPMQFAKP
jgi:hypothetical protein